MAIIFDVKAPAVRNANPCRLTVLYKIGFSVVTLFALGTSSVQAQNNQASCTINNEAALERVRNTTPVVNHSRLLSRLRVPESRVRQIFVGEMGKQRVGAFFTNNSGGQRFECHSQGCACFGIEDCNLMFKSICANPSTNGSCTGDVCTCNPF